MIISFLVSSVALIRDRLVLMHRGLRDVERASRRPRLSPSHESLLTALSYDRRLHDAALALFEGDDRAFWSLDDAQRALIRHAARHLGNVPLRPVAQETA